MSTDIYQTLDFSQAVTSFYMAESLKVKLNDIIANQKVSFLKRRFVEKKGNDFEYYNKTYVNNIANALFDYLTLICFGEARHSYSHCSYKLIDKLHPFRIDCYRDSIKYDPHHSLLILQDLFSKKWTSGEGVGGKKWLKIAQVASQYKKLPDIAFIDQAVNLYHNGGLCFDKGIIWTNVNTSLVKFLNAKNGTYLWANKEARNRIHYLYKHVNDIFYTLKGMRFIRAAVQFESVNSFEYKKIEWGNQKLQGIEKNFNIHF